jgi:hypothetical protein
MRVRRRPRLTNRRLQRFRRRYHSLSSVHVASRPCRNDRDMLDHGGLGGCLGRRGHRTGGLRLRSHLDRSLLCGGIDGRGRSSFGSHDRLRHGRLSRHSCRRLDDRRRRGRRRRNRPRRQEGQWVEVALRIARRADAEIDIRLRMVRDSARSDGSDDSCLADGHPAGHGDRAEVDECCRIRERCLDRDRLAARGNGAGKRDDSLRGCEHWTPVGSSEIEAAVLARVVRMGVVERERPQDRAVDRPGPRLRARHGQRERADE